MTIRSNTHDVALLPFRTGPVWLAIPALLAKEILDTRPPLPLPGAPAHVLGLVNVRGQALPMLDLAAFLDLPRDAAGGSASAALPRLIIVETGGMSVAVPCQEVLGVVAAGEVEVRPPDLGAGTLKTYAQGTFEQVVGIVTVIALADILQAARLRD